MQHGSSDLSCLPNAIQPHKHNCHQTIIYTQLKGLTCTACSVLVWMEEAGQGKAHTPILQLFCQRAWEEGGHVRRGEQQNDM